MDKRLKRKRILKELKFTAFATLIAAAVLAIMSVIYSLVRHASIIKSIYTTFYYFGAFSLLVAVPQLYKRNEDSNNRKIRRLSPLYGFYDMFQSKYAEQAMTESFEEFRGEGFWNGIYVVVFSMILFILAFLLENIYWQVYM